MNNLRMVKRDDWLEIEIAGCYSGYLYKFKIYPDGTVTEQNCDALAPDDCGSEPTTTDIYSALSDIAEVYTSNIECLGQD